MKTHTHSPSVYHHTFGAHEPVLEVDAGDVVVTKLVDASGRDDHDVAVTDPGNPMTGPFLVRGAAPGDALVVTVRSLAPNRVRGWTSAMLAPVTVDPEFVAQLDLGRGRIDWSIDAQAGAARPTEPLATLEDLVVPLRPMIGCLGVAPARGQRISTATSGPHGGNMDYLGVGVGVRLRFPVFVEGALFFVGDVHAAQGAGELAGTGIEVSADIEFQLEVERPSDPDAGVRWPRGETDDLIFTLGNARPLDQAAQHATTEMMRWLRSGYGLSTEAASVLIGQTCSYELGNMFDPAYTMVCLIQKGFLPERR